MQRLREPRREALDVAWPAQPDWVLQLPAVAHAGQTVHVIAGFEAAPIGSDGGRDAVALPGRTVTGDALSRVVAYQRLLSGHFPNPAAAAEEYQLVTEWTSLVAVLERADADKAIGLPETRESRSHARGRLGRQRSRSSKRLPCRAGRGDGLVSGALARGRCSGRESGLRSHAVHRSPTSNTMTSRHFSARRKTTRPPRRHLPHAGAGSRDGPESGDGTASRGNVALGPRDQPSSARRVAGRKPYRPHTALARRVRLAGDGSNGSEVGWPPGMDEAAMVAAFIELLDFDRRRSRRSGLRPREAMGAATLTSSTGRRVSQARSSGVRRLPLRRRRSPAARGGGWGVGMSQPAAVRRGRRPVRTPTGTA